MLRKVVHLQVKTKLVFASKFTGHHSGFFVKKHGPYRANRKTYQLLHEFSTGLYIDKYFCVLYRFLPPPAVHIYPTRNWTSSVIYTTIVHFFKSTKTRWVSEITSSFLRLWTCGREGREVILLQKQLMWMWCRNWRMGMQRSIMSSTMSRKSRRKQR